MAQQQTMFQVISSDGGTQTLTQEELQRYYPDIYATQVLAPQAGSPTYQFQYIINHDDSNQQVQQQVFHTSGHQQVMLQPTEQHTIINQPVKQGVMPEQQTTHQQVIYHQPVTPQHTQTQYVVHHAPQNVQIQSAPQQQFITQQSPQQTIEQQYIIQQPDTGSHEMQPDYQQQQQIFYATPVSEESRIITNMDQIQQSQAMQVQQQQPPEEQIQQQQQPGMDTQMQQYQRFLAEQKAKVDNLETYEAQQVRQRGLQQQMSTPPNPVQQRTQPPPPPPPPQQPQQIIQQKDQMISFQSPMQQQDPQQIQQQEIIVQPQHAVIRPQQQTPVHQPPQAQQQHAVAIGQQPQQMQHFNSMQPNMMQPQQQPPPPPPQQPPPPPPPPPPLAQVQQPQSQPQQQQQHIPQQQQQQHIPQQQQPQQHIPQQQQQVQHIPQQQQQQHIPQQQQHLPQQHQHIPQQQQLLDDNQIVQLSDGRQMTVAEWKRQQQQQHIIQQQPRKPPPQQINQQANVNNTNVGNTNPAVTNTLLQNRQADQQTQQQQQQQPPQPQPQIPQQAPTRFNNAGIQNKKPATPRRSRAAAATNNIVRPQLNQLQNHQQPVNSMNPPRMPMNQQMVHNQNLQHGTMGPMNQNIGPPRMVNTGPRPPVQSPHLLGAARPPTAMTNIGQQRLPMQPARPPMPAQMMNNNRMNQPTHVLNNQMQPGNIQNSMNNNNATMMPQQPQPQMPLNTDQTPINNVQGNMTTTCYGTPIRGNINRGGIARGGARGGLGRGGNRSGRNQAAPLSVMPVASPNTYSSTEPPALICTGTNMPGARGLAANRGNAVPNFRGGIQRGGNRGGRGGPRMGVPVQTNPVPTTVNQREGPLLQQQQQPQSQPLQTLQPQQQLPQQIEPSSPGNDEIRTAKMLVMLENGEQRLITFSLPKESCTVLELLEQVLLQVNVEFIPGVSNIRCKSNPGADIEYIVTVNSPNTSGSNVESGYSSPASSTISMSPGTPQSAIINSNDQKVLTVNNQGNLPQQQIPPLQQIPPHSQQTSQPTPSPIPGVQGQPTQQQPPPPPIPDATKAIPSSVARPNQQPMSSFQQSFCSNLQQQQNAAKFQTVDPNSFQYQLQQQINSEKFPEQKVPTEKETQSQPKEEETPKYIEGMHAVCRYCGYVSQDFNRCERCKRKLDNPKAIPKDIHIKKNANSENSSDSTDANSKSPDSKKLFQKLDLASKSGAITVIPSTKRCRRGKQKVPDPEPEVLTLSSDEEEKEIEKPPEEECTGINLKEKLGLRPKEPLVEEENYIEEEVPDIAKIIAEKNITDVPPMNNAERLDDLIVCFHCRTVRIGSYKCVPLDEVFVSKSGLKLSIPTKENKPVTLHIKYRTIVKLLVHFGKSLPIIFLYLLPTAGQKIRELLSMKDDGTEKDYYYNPVSTGIGLYRRIVLIPSELTQDDAKSLKVIFSGKLDELNQSDANEILLRACGDLPKLPHKEKFEDKSCNIAVKAAKTSGASSSSSNNVTPQKPLLRYPKVGRNSIPIYPDDYACLATDIFLNDVIIDFYLRFLLETILNDEQRERYHVFSTFFYKRLTSKPQIKHRRSVQDFENDASLTPAQRRHKRVSRWTRGIDIFEKDFIIIPINENSHWFLAIICFPNLDCARRVADNKPVDVSSVPKETTSKPAKKEEKSSQENVINVNPEDGEDRDEAEGSDSDLEQESDDDSFADESTAVLRMKELKNKRENGETNPNAIKQPCILIFDSLVGQGVSRNRVVATLRDYLTWEHREKYSSTATFSRQNMRGHCPKVPQQTNFTDCGLYVLQYVEAFITNPIRDYTIPIKHLKQWFDEFTVTKKREDIAILIKELMVSDGQDLTAVPSITFPTRNGILLEDSGEHDPDDLDFNHHEDEDELDDEENLEEEEEDLDHECDMDHEDMHHHPDSPSDIMDEEVPPRPKLSKSKSKKNQLTLGKCSLSVSKKNSNETVTSSSDSSGGFLSQSEGLKSVCANHGGEGSKNKSNRETMSYLKAKRIVPRKNTETIPDVKRQKIDF